MRAVIDPTAAAARQQLARAAHAFERGDYAGARRLAAELAASTADGAAGPVVPGNGDSGDNIDKGDTAQAARELLTRMAPDGQAVIIGAICAFFIAAIFVYYTMA